MLVPGLVLWEPGMERPGPYPEGVHPLEAVMLSASFAVVNAPGSPKPHADLLGDLPEHLGDLLEHLDVFPSAEVLGNHEHVAEAQHQPCDRERPGYAWLERIVYFSFH